MRLALVENASANGNPEKLVNAATEFRDLLAQAFSRRSIGGTLSWLRKLDKMGRDRLADLNYILSRASEPDEGRPGTVQDNLSVLPSPQTIEAKANGIINLELFTERLETNINLGGRVYLKGKVVNHELIIKTSGLCEAEKLNTEQTKLISKGGAYAYVKTRSLLEASTHSPLM